jgi:hypothetical protein
VRIEEERHLSTVSWAHGGPLFVGAYWARPTMADLEALVGARLAFYEARGKHAVITALRPSMASPLDEEMRRAAAMMRNKVAHTALCQAYLVEESGFMSAMIRGVLAGIMVASRSAFPAAVFGDVPAAAQFTIRHLAAAGKDLSADDIAALLERLGAGAAASERSVG